MVPRKILAGALASGLMLVLFVLVRPVSAAPALPIPQTISQPDGSTFQATAWGDEWDHGYETTDGYTIVRDNASGYWAYAVPQGETMAPAHAGARPLIVGKDNPSGLPKHVRPAKGHRPKNALPVPSIQSPFAPQAGLPRLGGPDMMPTIMNFGSQRLLLLLVSFTDRGPTYPAANFQNSFFGSGASVKTFYQEASYNKLNLIPAEEVYGTANDGVIGWLQINDVHPYTTNPDYPSDESPRIVEEALEAADPYINFAFFDVNHDGAISNTELHIVVVAAGYEQAFGAAPTPYIWAHRWNLDSGGYYPTFDGVRVGQSQDNGGYAIFGEIHSNGSGTQAMPHMATIGVMAHELGHDLDWPDLYDTSNLSLGVGSWSIMGSGSWNTLHAAQQLYGDMPALPDAFSRYYQGWLAPTQAYSGHNYTLPDSASSPSALLVGSNPNGVDWDFQNHSGSGEYWLVENRNQSQFDAALPGCGVLVWHVDEAVTSDNTANANRDHPLIELLQADGNRDLYYGTNTGDAGDPFPGDYSVAQVSTSQPGMSGYGSMGTSTLNILSPGCASSMTVAYNGSLTQGQYHMFLPLGEK